MPDYFAFASGKGGTGKSTLSAAIAKAVARKGKRVLIADMDIGLRSLDMLLRLENKVTFDLGDIIHGTCTPSQAIFPVGDTPGLWLVCAPLDATRRWDLLALLGALTQVAVSFDYVFIDVPAGLGFAQLILRLVPAVCVLVTTPDSISVRDNAKMRDIAVSLSREPLLLINRVSRSTIKASGCTDLDRVMDDVSAPLLAVFPEEKTIGEAANPEADPNNSKRGLFEKIAIASAGRLLGESIPIVLRSV